MKIKKGLITAAGEPQRRIPLQTLVDRDGNTRSVLAMLVNEILSAGVDEICIVIPPHQQHAYENAVADRLAHIHFVCQADLSGYASAVWCAREFLQQDSFLHLVGDHVYISGRPSWAARLVQIAEAEECAVSAVQPTHESVLSRFGVVGGVAVHEQNSLYKINTVIEKPTPTEAEQRVIVSGLRAGYYLAFFGMHVFTPTLLDILGQQIRTPDTNPSISGALNALASAERYLGWQVSGCRYDLGPRYGLLNAQLALALSGRNRDEVLSSILGLVATQHFNEKYTGENE
jgi:UTP--glucose-1-phosphate uridylyltransferase